MTDNEERQEGEGRPGKGEPAQWERDLISRLSMAALNEQRRARRWGIFFKFVLFGYLFLLLILAWPKADVTDKGIARVHTAMVQVNGVIADESEANAERIIRGLRNAVKDRRTKGVVLRINSPGGSPVQSAYIFNEVKRLRTEYPEIPIYSVIVDMGASGGYYVAAAADKIYVNESSIVGSIGVLMNGFGFVDTMDKLGVERRLLTAGKNKGILDPFSPLKKEDVAHAQQILNHIHEQFISAVKEGRGDRLSDNPQLFTGLFWSGKESIELGLADAVGNVDYVAREVIGAEEVVDYTPQPDLFERFAERFGLAMGKVLSSELGFGTGQLR